MKFNYIKLLNRNTLLFVIKRLFAKGSKEKKIWFTGLSRTLWIPKSIEGWSVTVAVIFALYLIFKINKISNDIPFIFSQHWPMLLELAVVVVTLYLVSKDHVDKKY